MQTTSTARTLGLRFPLTCREYLCKQFQLTRVTDIKSTFVSVVLSLQVQTARTSLMTYHNMIYLSHPYLPFGLCFGILTRSIYRMHLLHHHHLDGKSLLLSTMQPLLRPTSCKFTSVLLLQSEAGKVNRSKLTQPYTVDVMSRRLKSGSKKNRQVDDELEEDVLDDDDYDAPPNYKKMTVHLKSLRADSLISAALDISRNNVDEIFYASRLRLNGEKLLKKSKPVSERDYLDLIVERVSEEDKVMVKRVKVINIAEEKTNKDKVIVTVKVWKSAFPVGDTAKKYGET